MKNIATFSFFRDIQKKTISEIYFYIGKKEKLNQKIGVNSKKNKGYQQKKINLIGKLYLKDGNFMWSLLLVPLILSLDSLLLTLLLLLSPHKIHATYNCIERIAHSVCVHHFYHHTVCVYSLDIQRHHASKYSPCCVLLCASVLEPVFRLLLCVCVCLHMVQYD